MIIKAKTQTGAANQIAAALRRYVIETGGRAEDVCLSRTPNGGWHIAADGIDEWVHEEPWATLEAHNGAWACEPFNDYTLSVFKN